MMKNELRSSKRSKDAQAERILQSLSQKTRSTLNPYSKKIKKKKKSILDESIRLCYKLNDGTKKYMQWLMPKSKQKYKEKMTLIPEHKAANSFSSDDSSSNKNEEVNYAAIFESAYVDLKSESSKGKTQKTPIKNIGYKKSNSEEDIRSNDVCSAIEYNPIDNYFYLIADDNSSKKQFFKNQSISNFHQNPCVIIDTRIIEDLKKNYELDCFLC